MRTKRIDKTIKSNLTLCNGNCILRTPKDIWSELIKEFNFTIDCCASHNNHLLKRYYTIDDCL